MHKRVFRVLSAELGIATECACDWRQLQVLHANGQHYHPPCCAKKCCTVTMCTAGPTLATMDYNGLVFTVFPGAHSSTISSRYHPGMQACQVDSANDLKTLVSHIKHLPTLYCPPLKVDLPSPNDDAIITYQFECKAQACALCRRACCSLALEPPWLYLFVSQLCFVQSRVCCRACEFLRGQSSVCRATQRLACHPAVQAGCVERGPADAAHAAMAAQPANCMGGRDGKQQSARQQQQPNRTDAGQRIGRS